MTVLQTQIASKNEISLKTLVSYLGDGVLKLQCNFKYIQWYQAVLDSTEFKTYKPDPYKVGRRPSENIFYVAFSKKAIEIINLPTIFNGKNLKSNLVNNK